MNTTLNIDDATLVSPSDDSANHHIEQIVQAVRQHRGIDLPVVSGKADAVKTAHAIALGCLADNAFIEEFYLRWQTLVDRWYPGAGGYVLQTVARPVNLVGCVLIVGAGDRRGLDKATAAFLQYLEAHADGRLPWILDVALGGDHLPLPADRIDILGTSTSEVPTPESALPTEPYRSGFVGGSPRDHLLRLGMYGPHADNAHLSRSSQLGLRYLYSGQFADARAYRQALLAEADLGVIQRLYHYKSIRMFQLWQLLAPCPVFSAADRQQITSAIRQYLERESGLAQIENIQKAATDSGLFDRHIACEALNLWIGCDFFYREDGDPVWLQRREVADLYFERQSDVDVPITGLTEGYVSYLEVYLEWMLWRCPERIAHEPHLLLWVRRVLGLCTNAGLLAKGVQTGEERYPYHLLRKLAYLLNDGRLLYAAQRRERQVTLGNDRLFQFSAGQAYAGDIEAQVPDDETGLLLFAPNERLRQWQAPSIHSERGFDRLVGRSGWDVDDDYWLVVGMRSGGKCLPNVGSLAAYERFGQRLITADATLLYPGSASPWRHSIAAVSVGGLGGGMAEGAEVTARRSLHGGELLAYRVNFPGNYCWTRTLFWQPSAYLLVVDRLAVEGDEVFTAGINWRCEMAMERTGALAQGQFITDAGRAGSFWIETTTELSVEENAYPALGSPVGTPPTQEHLLHTLADGRGGAVEFATLLHAALDAEQPLYRLEQSGEAWVIVAHEESRLSFCATDTGDLEVDIIQPQQRLPVAVSSPPSPTDAPVVRRWQCLLPDAPSVWSPCARGLAIGTDVGGVHHLSAEGAISWSASCASPVTALTYSGEDLIAGTLSGVVQRFDERGQPLWQYQCSFRSERDFWPWWFMETPRISALATATDPRTGNEVLAVGTGGCALHLLDAKTGAPIADQISGYGLPDRIEPYLDTAENRLLFLVGHTLLSSESTVWAWPADEWGKPLRYYCDSVEPMGRMACSWDTCALRNFYVLTGAEDQLLVLRHGAVNQLTAYDMASARPLWDVCLGGPPSSLAVVPGNAPHSARIHVVDELGWWLIFDGRGKRLEAKRVARRLAGIQTRPDTSVVLWNEEELMVGTAGEIQARYSLTGSPLGWHESGLLCVEGTTLEINTNRPPPYASGPALAHTYLLAQIGVAGPAR